MSSGSGSRPLFIVIEGIDGSGSTTQGDRLAGWLRSRGHPSFFTHEPSSGPAGMLIRLALSRRLRGRSGEYHQSAEGEAGAASDIDPLTLALLYAADRTDHLSTEILPNLQSGRMVICDRYVLSSLAYQGMYVDEEWLISINKHAPTPDLTIYLDVPVEFAKHRMELTRWTKDLYEEEGKLRAIRDRYLALTAKHSATFGRTVVIEASQPIEAVTRTIREHVEELLSTPRGDTQPVAQPSSR